HLQALLSFPTRRSSDLDNILMLKAPAMSSCIKVGNIDGGVDTKPPYCTSPIITPRAVIIKIPSITAARMPRAAIPIIKKKPNTRSEEHTSELQSRFDLV